MAPDLRLEPRADGDQMFRIALPRCFRGGQRRLQGWRPRTPRPTARTDFEPLGEVDVEFPKGNPIRSCDWRLDLRALADLEVSLATGDNG